MADVDRVAGVLLGTAVGDMLGAPTEGFPREHAVNWAEGIRVLGPGVRDHLDIGQYTDDTQLTRELMISVNERSGFDPADFAARVLGLYRAGGILGIGLATEQACRRMERGVPWDDAGVPAPSAGNGTIMRAAPIGLLPLDAGARARAAHEQGWCTHRDPRCSSGSAGVAAAVSVLAELATGDPVDPLGLCARAADAMRPWDHHFAELVAELPDTLGVSDEEALARIGAAGRRVEEAEAVEYTWEGISPFVVPSLLWSLRSFLRHPDDFMAAVVLAIEGGGDTDSTAAVTGALAGARIGLAGIPKPYLGMVHDDGVWTGPDLIRLAVAFHETINASDPA
jgi:ADP-ribosylglycohydrolase